MTEDATYDWTPFLEATADRPPLPFFPKAMEYLGAMVPPGKTAIDLGCGGGSETRALLDMGWTVFAVDVTDAAKQLIEDRINAEQKDRLQIEIGSFETIELPPADLVYAQMSLPFAGDKFEQAVDNALAAVKKGGVFAGQFFGERDEWAGDPGTAAVPKEWVNERFRSFDRVEIDETDEEGPFGLEGLTKHWHYYYVLATR